MRPGCASPGGGELLLGCSPFPLASSSVGLASKQRGEEQGSGMSWWKLGSSVKEHEVLSLLPTLGVGESWFLFLVFFCLYCKLLGFGTKVTTEAKLPLLGAAGRLLRGAGTPWEPPRPQLGAQEVLGLQDEGMGTRGSGSFCPRQAKPLEPPMWSSHPMPAKGSMAVTAHSALPVPHSWQPL